METEDHKTILLSVRTPEGEITVELNTDQCFDLRDILPGSDDYHKALACSYPEPEDKRVVDFPRPMGVTVVEGAS